MRSFKRGHATKTKKNLTKNIVYIGVQFKNIVAGSYFPLWCSYDKRLVQENISQVRFAKFHIVRRDAMAHLRENKHLGIN